MQAALERMGIRLSRRTVGRILATNREAEGLPKPSRGRKERLGDALRGVLPPRILDLGRALREPLHPGNGQAYVVAILENYSRAILASAVTLSQDTNAYLSVLHAAIGRYGSPRPSSPTVVGSSARIGPRPSTGRWA